ncbi:iron chelate uptake ABC transporter family permease subunit [Corynebacterium aquilae]|uniref:Enterochelin ABC transporter permease n=1 Tax=Corynebacterium aquilae DSM 44791 TaxID=1431546 RepID=A0A1L7CHF0_9CORY|nr:iron chelate uptake ABC transporter family permease subunit [Corynebacterium aquilae]APT85276.1 enterochelin ABC transporter permease [Corynebacterium aquilae DSM 44791]
MLPKRSSGSSTTTFASPRARRLWWLTFAGLLIAAVGFTFGLLSWNNPLPFGSDGYWRIAKMRSTAIVVMLLVAICQGYATVAFQTVTNNRIITPSIMGFEALYVALHTASVFFLGAAGVTALQGDGAFLLQVVLMVGFSGLLYAWLLSGKLGNLHVMLLVGIVLGGGLRSLASFMQRLLTPSEFDILTAKLFGNISNAETSYLKYVIPVTLVTAVVLQLRGRTLNVLALGRDTANNLGVRHRRETIVTLFLVSLAMAMTTSLVGPMTFLGFLMATLAYQLCDTYDHRFLLPMSVLIGYVILVGSYFLMRNVFYAEGAVTIIIELIGGTTFLIFIMRKGRL